MGQTKKEKTHFFRRGERLMFSLFNFKIQNFVKKVSNWTKQNLVYVPTFGKLIETFCSYLLWCFCLLIVIILFLVSLVTILKTFKEITCCNTNWFETQNSSNFTHSWQKQFTNYSQQQFVCNLPSMRRGGCVFPTYKQTNNYKIHLVYEVACTNCKERKKR